ncbi:hypothetical protein BZA70DRAFT_277760 [Myxozyma melibiosi]|uniref:Ubiquitin carboxyl-terminal hydrolase n=1 Tax=Myxozyma melibiosi TaxID=54550 RepID=A0ABR1F870_9ASCO
MTSSDFAALWASSEVRLKSASCSSSDSLSSTSSTSTASTAGVLGGLVNSGNSCFANAVVQTLAASSALRKLLESKQNESELCRELDLLLERICARLPSQHSHSAAAFLGAMHKPYWTLSTAVDHSQQDAHEFFLALADCLREALAPGSGAAAEEVRLPIDGELESHVACLGCNEQQPVRCVPFSSLELTLPRLAFSPVSLQSMLEHYFAPEQIDSVYCQRCSLLAARDHLARLLQKTDFSSPAASSSPSSTSSKPDIRPILRSRHEAIAHALENSVVQDADFERLKPPRLVAASKRRQMTVRTAPENLVVHINRSRYDPAGQMPCKNTAAVTFPEILDFHDYLSSSDSSAPEASSDNNSGVVYRLASIIVHHGSHSMGHYIAYRRNQDFPLTWTRTSDKDVSDVSESEVLAQSNVTMLFYERISAESLPYYQTTNVYTCTTEPLIPEPLIVDNNRINIPVQQYPSPRISLAELISVPVSILSTN